MFTPRRPSVKLANRTRKRKRKRERISDCKAESFEVVAKYIFPSVVAHFPHEISL